MLRANWVAQQGGDKPMNTPERIAAERAIAKGDEAVRALGVCVNPSLAERVREQVRSSTFMEVWREERAKQTRSALLSAPLPLI